MTGEDGTGACGGACWAAAAAVAGKRGAGDVASEDDSRGRLSALPAPIKLLFATGVGEPAPLCRELLPVFALLPPLLLFPSNKWDTSSNLSTPKKQNASSKVKTAPSAVAGSHAPDLRLSEALMTLRKRTVPRHVSAFCNSSSADGNALIPPDAGRLAASCALACSSRNSVMRLLAFPAVAAAFTYAS